VRRLVEWAEAFGGFWYGFVIGDDWTIAAGVGAAIGLTYLLRAESVPAWWLLPLVAVSVVAFSIRRAERQSR
jgi:hypothetical protein